MEPNDATPRVATMPVVDAAAQVSTMVERLAMLHYHYARTLVEQLGESRGRALVAKAIESYGTEVGERQRERLLALGIEPSCENYGAVSDLGKLAWTPEFMPTLEIHGEQRPVCPMAKYWIERGASDLGRLYCHVDQAKYAAFDPECECRHPLNVLDGDDRCEIVAKKRTEWAEIDRSADGNRGE